MLGDRRSSRRFGGQRMSQSSIVWIADCSLAPQMHLGVSSMPQRWRHVPKRPTPVLNQFSATHRHRGSSEPDGRQTAGVTRNWAGGVALSHAAFHDSRRLKPDFSSAAAWRWKGRRECRRCVPRNCTLWTRVWRGWLVFICAWSASLKLVCFLRRWAGGMPVSTGKRSLRVGFRHPEMMRNVSFNATPSCLVWVLRHQAGAAYSAALQTRASAEVRRTEAWSPVLSQPRDVKGNYGLWLCHTGLPSVAWRLVGGRAWLQGKLDSVCRG